MTKRRGSKKSTKSVESESPSTDPTVEPVESERQSMRSEAEVVCSRCGRKLQSGSDVARAEGEDEVCLLCGLQEANEKIGDITQVWRLV